MNKHGPVPLSSLLSYDPAVSASSTAMSYLSHEQACLSNSCMLVLSGKIQRRLYSRRHWGAIESRTLGSRVPGISSIEARLCGGNSSSVWRMCSNLQRRTARRWVAMPT